MLRGVVVVMLMVMVVVMFVVMPQQQGTHEVHDQPDHGDATRLQEADGLRVQQSLE